MVEECRVEYEGLHLPPVTCTPSFRGMNTFTMARISVNRTAKRQKKQVIGRKMAEKFGVAYKFVYLCSEFVLLGTMQKMVIFFRRALLIAALAMANGAYAAYKPHGSYENPEKRPRRDTLVREVSREVHGFRNRMMTSSLPVEIEKQGRQLCITSKYNQLLPVYRDNGTFYTAFRVAKGTNWLTGLPKGTYIINNRRFTIS